MEQPQNDPQSRSGSKTPTWSEGTDFVIEVSRELSRAKRFGMRTALIVIADLPLARSALRDFFVFATTKLTPADLAGVLGNGDYAVCLPDVGPEDGEAIAEMLRHAMAAHSPAIGIATFPEDALTTGQLLVAATEKALKETLTRAA